MADTSPTSPSGNVYHRKGPRPHSRRRDGTERLESGTPVAKPSRRNDDNPARQTFLASIRKFAIVSAMMIVFLYLVLKGLQVMDDRYWSHLAQPNDDDGTMESQVMPTQGLSRVAAAPSATPTYPTNAPDSGNDKMRQAAFLAKRGSDLVADGKYEEAVASYRQALDLWPYMPQVWAELGHLHMRLGDYAKAQIALERATESSPDDVGLLNDLGVVYLQQGNTQSAIKTFTACVAKNPSSASPYFNLSLAYMARNNAAEAHMYLDRYLALVPDDPRALRQAAYFDASTNAYAAAIASLEKAMAKAPDWPLLYLDAAAAEALSGDTNKAVTYLQKASGLATPYAVQRAYAGGAFDRIRGTPVTLAFEKDLNARIAKASAAATSGTSNAQSPGPISSVSR